MALLVRKLGLLLLALASTAGQLLGSIAIDLAIPALGNVVHGVTVLGAFVALAAAGIAMIPAKKVEESSALNSNVASQTTEGMSHEH